MHAASLQENGATGDNHVKRKKPNSEKQIHVSFQLWLMGYMQTRKVDCGHQGANKGVSPSLPHHVGHKAQTRVVRLMSDFTC